MIILYHLLKEKAIKKAKIKILNKKKKKNIPVLHYKLVKYIIFLINKIKIYNYKIFKLKMIKKNGMTKHVNL